MGISNDDMVIVNGVQYRPEDVPDAERARDSSGRVTKTGPVTPDDMVLIDGVQYRPEDVPDDVLERITAEADATEAEAAESALRSQVDYLIGFAGPGVEFTDEQRQEVEDLVVAEDLLAAQQVILRVVQQASSVAPAPAGQPSDELSETKAKEVATVEKETKQAEVKAQGEDETKAAAVTSKTAQPRNKSRAGQTRDKD